VAQSRPLLRRGTAPLGEPPATLDTQPGPAAAGRASASRTPFILLLLGLLGGGLICLLVVNTTLAAASFKISDLQQGNAQLAQKEQNLLQQVATSEAPTTIERRAYRLGMRPQPVLHFIDVASGRRYTSPVPAGGSSAMPGYGR
jgi:hypothetical protein